MNLVAKLMKELGFTEEDVQKHTDFYNKHFDEWDNTIYEKTITRITHLINFLDKNYWLTKRFDLIKEQINKFDEIIDIGFDLPYLQIDEYITNQHCIFVDKYASAEQVTKIILEEGNYSIIINDIDDEAIVQNIQEKRKSENTALLCIETLEHFHNQQRFWDIARIINPKEAFITLPIGPIIPSHEHKYSSIEEAREYIAQYLAIAEERIIEPEILIGNNSEEFKLYLVRGNLHS